jgi:defect-in-organelle-trafficking protein DotB
MKKNAFVPIAYVNESSNFTAYELEDFLIWAVKNNVSDITIQNDEVLFCEIHGKKHKVHSKRLSKADLIGIITKIHSDGAVATVNSGEEIDYAFNVKEGKLNHRFRVNIKSVTVAGDKGFSLSIRVLNSKPPRIEELNLPEDMLKAFKSKRGLIIVSGATGSGKSTTLASVIVWRMTDPDAHIKISTYESPIEYTFDDYETPTATISQMEIGTNLQGTFGDGARNSLRTRSDVVLIGESRDYDTISATINAAMTGPLVYTTLHTNNASEIIARLINVFPSNERKARIVDLITNLKMLVTQALVPSVDGKRLAVREYVIFNQEIVDLLLEADFDQITHVMRRIVKQYGKTFLEDLTEKYEQGLISKEVFEEYK